MTKEALGGAETHSVKSGVAHFTADTEKDFLLMIRELISFLPSNNQEDPPFRATNDDPLRRNKTLKDLVPDNPEPALRHERTYRCRRGRRLFLRGAAEFARNILIGFARLGGGPPGWWQTNRRICAGCLDINASVKAARFIRFCDCFNIPVVTFVDVPGFLPGIEQEYHGIIRHGAKLLYAYAEATVPKGYGRDPQSLRRRIHRDG